MIELWNNHKFNLKNFSMFCLLSAFFLSIMGIFSSRYRSLAKEALKCIFKKVSFKPCDINFDDKIKAKLLTKLAFTHPQIAHFIIDYFEIISYLIFFLSLIAFFLLFRGVYFYLIYGNCDGLSGGFCVLNNFRS